MELELLYILVLLIGGIGLIVLELLAIPGTTIAGISGLAMTVYGVYMVYDEYGMLYGNISLFVVVTITILLLIYSLRNKTWRRFSLNKELEGRAIELREEDFKKGDTGIAITRLALAGTAQINDKRVEVFAVANFIDPNTEIVVDYVEDKKIFVRPLKKENN